MMKKISFLMLFALSFLILSCRTEEFHNEEVNQTISQPRLTSKRISLNESKHKSRLLPDLEKAETAIEKKALKVQGKSVNIGNGITIDTDEVIYIENGSDFHTYTFSVIRDNASANAPVENILMTPNTDGSYRVFHIVLNLTEADKSKIANREYVDYKNKQQVTELAGINLSSLSQKQMCVPHYFSYPVSCKEGLHEPGQPCAYAGTSGAAYWGSIILYDCFGEEPETIMPTPMPIDGGGGGGGECPDCPDNTNPVQCVQIATNPTQVGIIDPNGCIVGMPTEPYVVKSFNLIVRTLPAEVKALLNSNTQFYNGLQTYYNANQNQQGENFVKWAAQFSWENQNVTWAEFQPMLTFAHNFLQENPNVKNHFTNYPEDLNKILFKGINYNNTSDVTFANKFALAFTDILIAEKNNTVSQVNVQDPAWTLAKEYMIYLIKQNAASAVKYGRIIYEHASQYFTQHPNSLQKVNEFLAYLKAGVQYEIPIQYNPKYMKWTDILLCWLFELGDFPINNTTGFTLPTIGFSGSDYTISGIPSPNIIPMRYLSAHKMKNGIPDTDSVLDLRKRAIQQIQAGNMSSLGGEWGFGSDATVDTITKLDGMQFCLGSYPTVITITPLGNNQYKLTFVIKNKTGWQSGTRGLNDYNGNPLDDSIIPDKPRGEGVHLGGTIGETFGWYEIITVP